MIKNEINKTKLIVYESHRKGEISDSERDYLISVMESTVNNGRKVNINIPKGVTIKEGKGKYEDDTLSVKVQGVNVKVSPGTDLKNILNDVKVINNKWDEIKKSAIKDWIRYIKDCEYDKDNEKYIDDNYIESQLKLTNVHYSESKNPKYTGSFEVSIDLKEPVDEHVPFLIVMIRKDRTLELGVTSFEG